MWPEDAVQQLQRKIGRPDFDFITSKHNVELVQAIIISINSLPHSEVREEQAFLMSFLMRLLEFNQWLSNEKKLSNNNIRRGFDSVNVVVANCAGFLNTPQSQRSMLTNDFLSQKLSVFNEGILTFLRGVSDVLNADLIGQLKVIRPNQRIISLLNDPVLGKEFQFNASNHKYSVSSQLPNLTEPELRVFIRTLHNYLLNPRAYSSKAIEFGWFKMGDSSEQVRILFKLEGGKVNIYFVFRRNDTEHRNYMNMINAGSNNQFVPARAA